MEVSGAGKLRVSSGLPDSAGSIWFLEEFGINLGVQEYKASWGK